MPRYTGTRKRGAVWYFQATIGGKAVERRASEYGFPNTAEGARDARQFAQSRPSAPGSRGTVAAWVAQYISSRYTLKPASVFSYRGWHARFIASHSIGAVPLADLTRVQVAAWQGELLARFSPAYVSSIHALLSGALNAAVRDELIPRNVARLTPPPRPTAHETPVWDVAQIRQWLRATAADELAALWRLYVTTGLRTGELLALRWQDVDLRAGVLRVRQGRTHTAEGAVTIGEPKRGSRRELPLLPDDVAALRAHQDRQTFGRPRGELVFCRLDGTMLRHQTIGRRLRALCAAAGLPDMSPHQLRHCHGTLLAAIGTDQKTISARLGHKNAASSERYIRATQSMHQAAAGRLAASLEEPANPEDETRMDGTRRQE